MPASFRLLLVFLVLCLGACAGSAPSPSADKRSSYLTGSTPINAPGRAANETSMAPAPQPVRTPAALPPQPTAPARATRSKVIVMGTPLPGTPSALAPTPTPRPFPPAPDAAPSFQGLAPIPAGEAAPTPAAPQGPPTGFGGIAWGTSAKAVPGLAIHQVNASLSDITYIWPAGPKQVMGTPIRDAFFEFYQDHFYHVWIDLDGMQAYQDALAGLKAAYGPPTTENLEKHYHAWTIGDVNIYCAYHPEEREGDVSFFYQPIYERLDAARNALQRRWRPTPKRKS